MLDAQYPVDEQIRRFGFSWDSVPSFGEFMDFWSFSEKVVNAAPPNSTIVEVGVFHGRSLCCLGLFAKEANKGLKIIGIDSGVGMNPAHNTNPLAKEWLRKAGLADFVTLVEKDSYDAVHDYADESVWLTFIDSSHLHDAVEKETRNWMPKIQRDGWLTYHDAIMYTVAEPIIAMFGHDNIIYDERWQDIFILRKQEPKDGVDVRAGTYMPPLVAGAWKV